jgi:hypothetical protein
LQLAIAVCSAIGFDWAVVDGWKRLETAVMIGAVVDGWKRLRQELAIAHCCATLLQLAAAEPLLC